MKEITLATLRGTPLQDIFDVVAEHLLKQGRRSEIIGPQGSAMCMYRGSNGLKCAAGVLISDSEYRVDFEGFAFTTGPAGSIANWEPSPYKGVRMDLITHLQRCHDKTEPRFWLEHLKDIAKDFGLEWRSYERLKVQVI